MDEEIGVPYKGYKNKEKRREYLKNYLKQYRNNPEYKKYASEYCLRRLRDDGEARRKQLAVVKVNNAKRNRNFKKGVCEVCGCSDVEGHHKDYNKPLEVMWLCRLHHLQLHGKLVIF